MILGEGQWQSGQLFLEFHLVSRVLVTLTPVAAPRTDRLTCRAQCKTNMRGPLFKKYGEFQDGNSRI